MKIFFSTIVNILWTQIVSKFKPSVGLVEIGEHTYGNPKIITYNSTDKLIIGKYCSISDDSFFICGGEHNYRRISSYPLKSRLITSYEVDAENRGPIIVGNDVWIGAGAIILSGITIGDGSVIGAGAVVTKDVPPYAIVAGVPAKIIKYRFNENQVNSLIKISWWDWDVYKIKQNIQYFYKDIDEFITKFE